MQTRIVSVVRLRFRTFPYLTYGKAANFFDPELGT